MKTLFKTSILAAFLMLISIGYTNAQDSPLSIGIKGGINVSNFGGDGLQLKGGSLKYDDNNLLVGFKAGLTADYAFSEYFSFVTGLEYVMKGAKMETKGSSSSAYVKLNPGYIQLPAHLAFKVPFTDEIKFVVHGGGFAAYGVTGKVKTGGTLGSSSLDFELGDMFGDNGLVNNFDAGVGIGIGVELGKLSFDLGYDLGLMDISKSKNTDNSSIKTQSAALTVGIRF